RFSPDGDTAPGKTALYLAEPAGEVEADVFTVNSVGDDPDADITDEVADTGRTLEGGAPEVTLRAAIEQANASKREKTIRFALPDPGQLVTLATALPAVVRPL